MNMDSGHFIHLFTLGRSEFGTFSYGMSRIFETFIHFLIFGAFLLVWYLFRTVGTRKTNNIAIPRRSAWGGYTASDRDEQRTNRDLIFVLIFSILFVLHEIYGK